ncbi:RIP metalloprotease RseP [Litorivita sp. NS0012-18]|uniref:RIP metalloprotease RseP n=1 Tax=Litorivita sp. NS0012-18 TaxID=3127655 RepID=UPI003101FD36
MLDIIPQFGGLLGTIAAFVVALSVIVAIHEYGHYIIGRLTGIKAEVFSLGFGPVIYSRVDKHGTKWQFAALPFGGYVKFLGDANAASGKDGEAMEAMPEEMLRHTMHGAPLWARAATVAAGPVFNFMLSIAVFAVVIALRGQVSEPLTVGEMRPTGPAIVELMTGDEILKIGGMDVPSFEDSAGFDDLATALPKQSPLEYTVLRGGQERVVAGPYLYPPIVTQLSPKSAAYEIDMKVGDVITAVDGAPIAAFAELKEAVEASQGTPLKLDVWRDGEMIDFVLTPRATDEPQEGGSFATNWRIGIAGGLAFEPATAPLGIGTSLWAGVTQTGEIMRGSVSGLWHMITGQISSCNMAGPISIAKISKAQASQGVESFIWFIAVLSTAVGLLNLFPIPMLDGGHLVFYAYEAVAGRPPNDKVLRILMAIGMTIVLSLMLFALFNDVTC